MTMTKGKDSIYEYENGNMLMMQNNSIDTDPSEEFAVDNLSASPLPFTAGNGKFSNAYLNRVSGTT